MKEFAKHETDRTNGNGDYTSAAIEKTQNL